jgi:long-chain fatty acid transport protein
MKTTRFLTLLLCTISFICLYAANASSGGFAIAEQTAFGVGQGNAITAGVEDPSAIYINPAGLSEIDGNQMMGGQLCHKKQCSE